MDSIQPEISPPEIPAENAMTPAILWKGDHSLLAVMSGRSHLQIGPIGRPDGMDNAENTTEPAPATAET